MAIPRIKRRKGKELERPVCKPVPLIMQPLRILAGAFINDIVDERGYEVAVVYRQRDGTLAVGEGKGYAHTTMSLNLKDHSNNYSFQH